MAEAVHRRVIELSEAAYTEIEAKLVEGGFDWLVFPPRDSILMDGFIITRSTEEGTNEVPSV